LARYRHVIDARARSGGGSTAQGLAAPIQLDYRPTVSDYVKTAVASASRSVIAVAVRSYLVGIAIVPILGGDLASWMSLLVGLALVTGLYVAPFIRWAVRRRPDLMVGSHGVTVDAWGVRTETATAKAVEEAASRPQEPRRLGEPALGHGPQRRTVLG